MEVRKAIAQRIRELRKQAGLSQQQVADALGVDRSAYTYFENGVTDIKLERLVHLSNIFSISLEQMLPQELLISAGNADLIAETCVVHEKGVFTKSIDETSMLLLYRKLPAEIQLQFLAILQQIPLE